MMGRLQWVQDHGFAVSDEMLGLFRLVFFGLVIVQWDGGTLLWVDDYPDWLRNPPPGLPQLAMNLPPAAVLWAIDVVIGLSALAAFLGIKARLTSISFALLTIVHHSYVYSYGKIDHDFLVIGTAFVFSFSGWGNRFTVTGIGRWRTASSPESRTANSRVVAVHFTLIAVAFFSAGLAKFRGGWLDSSSQMARNWVNYYSVLADPPLATPALALPSPIWELIDIATVVLELGLLLLLLLPRLTRIAVAFLVLFHVSILATMGIDFQAYLVIYLPLLAHPEAGRSFGRWWERKPNRSLALVIATVCGARLVLRDLIPLAGGEGVRYYLPNLISFGIAIVIALWFARSDRAESPGELNPALSQHQMA